MSLLPFWALNVSVALLSMQGQKALWFYQKYLNLFSEDEQRSYGLEQGWVINDRIFIFGWTTSLRSIHYYNSLWYWLKKIMFVLGPNLNLSPKNLGQRLADLLGWAAIFPSCKFVRAKWSILKISWVKEIPWELLLWIGFFIVLLYNPQSTIKLIFHIAVKIKMYRHLCCHESAQ